MTIKKRARDLDPSLERARDKFIEKGAGSLPNADEIKLKMVNIRMPSTMWDKIGECTRKRGWGSRSRTMWIIEAIDSKLKDELR